MHARTLLPLLAVPLFLLLCSSCGQEAKAPKAPAQGTVRGRVQDEETEAPLAGAKVEVGDASGLTTPEGTYEISVTYGSYYVTVTKDGYESYKSPAEIKVPPDGVATHDVALLVEDDEAPQVQSFAVKERQTTFVVLAWSTDEEAKARVQYGLTSGYGRIVTTPEARTDQQLRIDGLEPGRTYHYRIEMQDGRGNVSEPLTGTFETTRPRDTQAPSTSITKAPDPVTRTRNVGFAWTARDDRSRPETITYSFYLEGLERQFSVFVSNTTRIFRNLKDGSYVFRIRARDEDGNVEEPAVTFPFEVDTTPPRSPSLLTVSGKKYSGTRAVDLVCAAEGAHEMTLWTGDPPARPAWTPYRDKRQFILPKGDGEKLVFVRYRDRAGNETEAVSCAVVLDTEPPTRPEGVEAKALSATEVRFSWKPARDEGSGVASYLVLRDGLEIGKARATSFVDRDARLGRRYAYSVQAVDRLERTSDPSAEAVVTLTGTAPRAPSAPGPAHQAENQPTSLTLTWTGGDDDRGDRVTYDLYFGTEPSPPRKASALPNPSFPLQNLRPAQLYYWRVEARDLQGMTATGPVWSFRTAEKPNAAPRAEAAVDPSSGPARTEFRFDASRSTDKEDGSSGLSFCWDWDGDGKADTPWRNDPVYRKTFQRTGTYEVSVWVRDGRGAVGKARVRVEVKNSPPVLEGAPMPVNGSTGEPVDVKLAWTFRDGDPGDTLTYDVYLGEETGKLRMVARRQKESSYRPEGLRPGRLYYWRVDARDASGAVTQGPMWSFATAKKSVRLPLRAEVSVHPRKGRTTTPFRFDASGCRDPEDDPEALTVRWDWDGDGKADTDWSTGKQEVKSFTGIGERTVGLEVRNTSGKTAKATVTVTVENTPPSFVGRPVPRNGATGVLPDAALVWDVADPDPDDRVTFRVLLGPADGDGMKLAVSAHAEKSFRPSQGLSPGKVYNWRVVAEDSHGGRVQSPIWTFSVKERRNNAPYKPLPLEGPDRVRRGERLVVKTQAKDPDDDRVRIRFDWGDGTVSPWGEANSQGFLTLSHLFAKEGNYAVRAQAMDANNTPSPWSDRHLVKVLPPVKPGEEEEDLWHWAPETRKSMAELLTFQARYWFANFRGSGAWKGVGDPLSDLDYRSDLGLTERKGAPWFLFEFGRNLSAGLEYFFLEYAGQSTLASDVRFGGFSIAAGTDVTTSSKVRFGQVFANFSPWLGTYWGAGVRLGAGWFWTRTTVTPQPAVETQVETLEFPVPLVGLHAYGRLTKYFTVRLEASYIEGGLQEFKLLYGRLFDVLGGVLFTPVPYVGLEVGYRFTAVKIRAEETPDTLLDLSLDGFYLSLRFRF